LHQALMNLLTNAVEAVPEKKGVITVRTSFKPESHLAEIVVSDNGPGVADEWRDHIFQAFTSTKGQRGTGLGLAVTKKIIEEHGGHVELAAQVSKGATFVITLPSDRATGMDPGDTKLPRPITGADIEDEFASG
jgi:two-component system, NtrC family, sensor kinase